MSYLLLALAAFGGYVLVGAGYMYSFYRRALRGHTPTGCPLCDRRRMFRHAGAVVLAEEPMHRRITTWVAAGLGWPLRLLTTVFPDHRHPPGAPR
ncbi:hypothetical protein ACFPZ0_10330 [Streptomonospora nanhaiensis]|uniref:hypothetical protein n=1 Tax=Streptomonospora nanhaiensis TaxID=1323731 RepID=UPI001C383B81|nr:hypothetical protein [Streptomonospora nanhaiensis]MBV2364983.1 hypothetical protein [Streptomonospora nanhaiensis]MBX9389815.1 hypothetical protein [Streptomonospora nanhaiensis]